VNTIKILLAAVLVAGLAPVVHAGDFRVGYVDTERIMRESVPAIKAGQKLEKEFAARNQEIKKLAKQVQDMQDFLEKQGASLSEMERGNKERELSSASMDLQRMQREFREDFSLRQNEELAGVLERANKAIQEIAVSEKYDLILQEAVYRNPRIDITDEVLKYLATDKSAAGKKPAAP
jgi:outer membrane protein